MYHKPVMMKDYTKLEMTIKKINVSEVTETRAETMSGKRWYSRPSARMPRLEMAGLLTDVTTSGYQRTTRPLGEPQKLL
jgi:hypothetical protein